MAILSHFPIEVPLFGLLIFIVSIGFVFTIFNYTVLNDSAEQPITFNIPIPEQCKPDWKGEVLEEPSIRVTSSP